MASQLYVQVPADYGDLSMAGLDAPLLKLMTLRPDCGVLLNLHLQMVLYSVRWRTEGFISIPVMCRLAYPASTRTAKRYGEILAQADYLEPRDGGYFVPAAKEWPVVRVGNRDAIPDRVRDHVFERDGWRCTECGSRESLTIDHIIPWSRNGSDDAGNLRALCGPCNSSKGARI